MNLLSRLNSVFHDNPASVNRGTTRFSGPMVAVAGVLLNLFILSLIFPFLINPDDEFLRSLTDSLGFGGLFSLILLGGTLVIATFLIPFRLATVFMGPRIGRYFDQIVLSGIAPFRLLIGNVAAQCYLVALLLFLLTPHMVLAVTLGGFQVLIFLGCLILIVVYCVMLSLCTLWLSLYVNEIVAGLVIVALMLICGSLGAVPESPQPMLMTPVPAMLQPVYHSMPSLAANRPYESFLPVFAGCLLTMSLISGVALLFLHLGPLYGIVKFNSTFGEVVKPGDASKRRRFRFRLHIQRPSEIAFFYQNRASFLTRSEGLIRWGLGVGALVLLVLAAEAFRAYLVIEQSTASNMSVEELYWNFRRVYGYHAVGLMRHGLTLAIGIYLFSHSRNTTMQSVQVFGKKWATVSRMDWIGFLCLMSLSTVVNIAGTFGVDYSGWLQNSFSVLPDFRLNDSWRNVNYFRMLFEGTMALNLCGLTAYLIQRCSCQKFWVKTVAFFWTVVLCGVVICGLPVLPLAIIDEFTFRSAVGPLHMIGAAIAMVSPILQMIVIGGETEARVPFPAFWWVFYLSQAAMIFWLLRVYRRGNRRLELELLKAPAAAEPSSDVPSSKASDVPTEDSQSENPQQEETEA